MVLLLKLSWSWLASSRALNRRAQQFSYTSFGLDEAACGPKGCHQTLPQLLHNCILVIISIMIVFIMMIIMILIMMMMAQHTVCMWRLFMLDIYKHPVEKLPFALKDAPLIMMMEDLLPSTMDDANGPQWTVSVPSINVPVTNYVTTKTSSKTCHKK